MTRTWMLGVVLAGALAPLVARAQCVAPACNKIVDNGPDGQKLVLVVLGDGYAAADQQKYNDDVDRLVRNGVFGHDFFQETQNAFNVYRVNLVSNDSGVSQRVYDEHGTWNDASDDTITSTTTRDTALGYIWSGSWAHCWLEGSSNTWQLEQAALNANVPQRDFVVVLLNQDSYGGCGGGGHQTVPRGVTWQVLAHEYGHGVGGLMDEYVSFNDTYPGGTVQGPNCTTVLNPLPWARFRDPLTGVPTTCGAQGADANRTVGAFEGCLYHARGIYRPVCSCRMNNNTPDFCPVCRNHMMTALYPHLGHDFDRAVTGDFTGDGHTDLVLAHPGALVLYRAESPVVAPRRGRAALDLAWIANGQVPPATGVTLPWEVRAQDQLLAADLDGDGKQDLVVLNTVDWPRPRLGLLTSTGTGFVTAARYDGLIGGCWTLHAGDQLLAGDFDGDGKTDLFVWHPGGPGDPVLGLLRSTGSGLQSVIRYEGSLPGWALRSNDRFVVGDFDGDHKADLYAFNPVRRGFPLPGSWSHSYLGMLHSTGTGLHVVRRYQARVGTWVITGPDQLIAADFDGDGKADLYAFSPDSLPAPLLGMLRSTGNALAPVRVYGGPQALPGWTLRRGDRLHAADVDGNGRVDLVAFNADTSGAERLAPLVSGGQGLTAGAATTDWVGRWNLGHVDLLSPGDYEGRPGIPDLVIRNPAWLGLIRHSATGYQLDRIYHQWIYTALYDTGTLP